MTVGNLFHVERIPIQPLPENEQVMPGTERSSSWGRDVCRLTSHRSLAFFTRHSSKSISILSPNPVLWSRTEKSFLTLYRTREILEVLRTISLPWRASIHRGRKTQLVESSTTIKLIFHSLCVIHIKNSRCIPDFWLSWCNKGDYDSQGNHVYMMIVALRLSQSSFHKSAA